MKRTLLQIAATLIVACSAFTQTDLSGVWLVRSPNQDGTARKQLFKLTQQGNTLSGTVVYNYRPMEITGGSISGGKFHFVVGRGPRHRTFDGSLEGDHLVV